MFRCVWEVLGPLFSRTGGLGRRVDFPCTGAGFRGDVVIGVKCAVLFRDPRHPPPCSAICWCAQRLLYVPATPVTSRVDISVGRRESPGRHIIAWYANTFRRESTKGESAGLLSR